MASTVVPSTRSFTALNGSEVKKAILADITNQLERDTRFAHHLSFAAITWKFKIAIDCYPTEIGSFKVETGGTLHPKDARPLEPDEQSIPVDISGGREVTAGFSANGQTADQVRRETGQPVLTAKTISGPAGERVTVEAPQVPTQAREAADAPKQQASETNVPGGKGILARRATLRTKAAPEGVEVAPAAGSSPNAEDAAKIIEEGLRDGTLEPRQE